jgi:hypothetical protein
MHQVEHHFAEEHILERPKRRRIILGTQILKRLVEVRVCCRIVFVLRV